jgi:hypothetical protein
MPISENYATRALLFPYIIEKISFADREPLREAVLTTAMALAPTFLFIIKKIQRQY